MEGVSVFYSFSAVRWRSISAATTAGRGARRAVALSWVSTIAKTKTATSSPTLSARSGIWAGSVLAWAARWAAAGLGGRPSMSGRASFLSFLFYLFIFYFVVSI
jgi:hypothetical protein